MRVSRPIASLFAAAVCLAATVPTAALAQNDVANSAAATDNTTIAFNPDEVVEEIVLDDQVSDAVAPSLLVSGNDTTADGDGNAPAPAPELRNPFIQTIAVHRPFDDLVVTTPDVGPIAVVRVKDGEKSKSPRKPFLPPQTEYLYGEFLILRARTISEERVLAIRAPADQPAKQTITLKHTLTNTKVSSDFTTNGWETEDTVAKRAEEQVPALSALTGSSRDLTRAVRGAVSTTFAASQAGTVDVSKGAEFTLTAPAGKVATLWTDSTQLDVYVCKARKNKIRTNPIDGQCDFSHSVTEEGTKYKVTVSSV